ncbi:MAG: hypothetical protein ACRD4Y_04970 [Candidatus Acidiferrales bacterium]
MIGKILAGMVAVVGAAALTLATMIALVKGTIVAVSIAAAPLRILAVLADIVIGTVLLVGCLYLATQLAVHILGAGDAPFPLPPDQAPLVDSRSGDSPKN